MLYQKYLNLLCWLYILFVACSTFKQQKLTQSALETDNVNSRFPKTQFKKDEKLKDVCFLISLCNYCEK